MYDTLKYNSFCRKTLKYDTFCRETLKYDTFCRETLKYDTFCRKTLKYGTFCRKNLDYALRAKKWQICVTSRLHILCYSGHCECALWDNKCRNPPNPCEFQGYLGFETVHHKYHSQTEVEVVLVGEMRGRPH